YAVSQGRHARSAAFRTLIRAAFVTATSCDMVERERGRSDDGPTEIAFAGVGPERLSNSLVALAMEKVQWHAGGGPGGPQGRAAQNSLPKHTVVGRLRGGAPGTAGQRQSGPNLGPNLRGTGPI